MNKQVIENKNTISWLADVVKKYLVLLSLFSTILALPIGFYFNKAIVSNKPLISHTILLLAFLVENIEAEVGKVIEVRRWTN